MFATLLVFFAALAVAVVAGALVHPGDDRQGRDISDLTDICGAA